MDRVDEAPPRQTFPLPRRPAGAARGLAALLWRALHLPRDHPVLSVILLAGLLLRVMQAGVFHYGDMDVLLSAVYATLSWPPFGYYHAYRPQPWVYNHLPVFPMATAPFYWLCEYFHLPTYFAVKGLTAVSDLAIAVLLYRQAGARWRGALAPLLAAAWLLTPWPLAGDDHPVSPAIALALGAAAAANRGWLCGLLLALAVGVRNEAAFFVLPMALYLFSRRNWRQFAAFGVVFTATLALIVVPFVLEDSDALDYALRRQIQRDAASQLSMLHAMLLPIMGRDLAAWLQQNPSVLAFALNLAISPLALRDRWVDRVLVVAAAGYLLTLPVVHERYMLFAYAMALFFVARGGGLVVALLAVAMMSQIPSLPPMLLAAGLAVALAVDGLLFPAGRQGMPHGTPAESA